MTKTLGLFVTLAALVGTGIAQTIPSELFGRWVVRRELQTSTISCWGETEAKTIIGTEIEYAADSFRWKDKLAKHPTAKVAVVTARQFHDENSGRGANSSQVTLRELGVKAGTAKHILIDHSGTASGLPNEPMEMPGDDVLVKNNRTIIFSMCNLYFEAERVTARDDAQGKR